MEEKECLHRFSQTGEHFQAPEPISEQGLRWLRSTGLKPDKKPASVRYIDYKCEYCDWTMKSECSY